MNTTKITDSAETDAPEATGAPSPAADATDAPEAHPDADSAATGDEGPAGDGSDTGDRDADEDTDARAARLQREAAQRRRDYRNEQTAHQATRAELDAYKRDHAERLAADVIAKPAALWATTDLADLLGDDGKIDPAKVTAAAENARDTLGLQPPQPRIGYGGIFSDMTTEDDHLGTTGGFLDALNTSNQRA